MATVRELQASFVAKVGGMKSAIQGVTKDVDNLAKNTKKATGSASGDFSKMSSNTVSASARIGGALTGFGNGLAKVSDMSMDVGKKLTKWITLPAAGVATALGAITAKLGWDRLVGLDSAKAQLEGLGYTTEDVGRITKQVTSAIDGGMTTMAEGTSVAAGALAAGVDEGAELERYIKLVGDAAVGSNRPVGDMAQIFNRVQGSGKLMTQELNMIEQGMPGFSKAMADHLKVAPEEMSKMVTDGKVSSEDFLTVMEGFAGGMAGAYAKSWSGMVANTKAYIGIIGEQLLGGVFEKSKESIAEFVKFLSSDKVIAWAEKTGKSLGVMFSNVVDKVKSAIEWFSNLSNSQQAMITKFGAIAIAIGPVLTVLGLFGGFVSKVSLGLGTLATSVSKAGGFLGIFSKTTSKGTKKVGLLARAFTLLTGPVGITIGIISALVAGFVLAYKKSETFRNFVNKLKDSFVAAYKKVKEFLTTNESFLSFIDSIKKGFQTLKDKVQEAVGAVVSFFKDKIGELKAFWDSDGKQFLEAVSNVFEAIWFVVEPIIKAIVAVVKASLPIIQKIFELTFKAVFAVVKMVWDNIKGVIDGGLNVIMGLVKTFSGLFTGDFDKMWEGIKQMFMGAVKFIWNFVQLTFFGKLIKGAGTFIKLFSKPITKMWGGIQSVFTTVIKWIVNYVKTNFARMQKVVTTVTTAIQKVISKIWNAIWGFFKKIITSIIKFIVKSFTGMKNTVTSIFTAIQKFISKIWNAILGFFKKVIKSIINYVKNSFTTMKKNITTIFNGIQAVAKKVWNTIKNNIINPVKSGVNWAIKKFKDFKTSVSTTFKNIKDSVFGYVSDMIKKVKDMPGEMKKKIVDGAGKVKDAMQTIGKKMMSPLKSAVNGVRKGVNWVLGKFKMKEIGKWTPSAPAWLYAKGTGGHPGGDAIMGDGRGSNSGEELVNLPNGKSFLSADKPTLYPDLPKGTEVLPAKLTKKVIPQYKDGVFSKIGNTVSSAYGTAKDTASDVYNVGKVAAKKGKDKLSEWSGNIWDYMKHPSKLLSLALNKVGAKVPDASSLVGKIAKGGFKKVKDSGIDYIKGVFKKKEEEGGGPAPTGGAKAWKGHIQRAAARVGVNATEAEIQGVIKQIQRESGGNEKIIQSPNVVDINTLRGNPAQGLLQYIPQTFRAYAMKGHKKILTGYDQLLAFFNNTNWRKDLPYGTRGWGPSGARKYADGAYGINTKQLAWIADGGWAESIISHDPAKKVRSQKIWQKTGDELGFTDKTLSSDDSVRLLERITKAIENDKDTKLLSQIVEAVRAGHIISVNGEMLFDVHKEVEATKNIGRYMG